MVGADNPKVKYLSIDCETGGIGLDKSLLTLGLVLYNDKLEEVDSAHFKTRPEDGIYRVTAGGLQVNKINLIEHDKEAISYQECNKILRQTLYNWSSAKTIKLIPIGKQVDGDLAQIWDKLLARNAWEEFVSYRKIEVSSIMLAMQAIGIIPEFKGSLSDCASYFGINYDNLHDALADARITAQVYKAILKAIAMNIANQGPDIENMQLIRKWENINV